MISAKRVWRTTLKDHRAVVLAVKRINVKVAATTRKGKPRQKEKASLSLWRQRLPVQAAEASAKG
ncbi:MAG: hypothetical protein PHT35_04950 [Bacteroidales bacterium]|nr:hypothetical protein [Bacteroidales bacterium]MDD4030726.1 hypothetical protein [Bacteroidales bacterium]